MFDYHSLSKLKHKTFNTPQHILFQIRTLILLGWLYSKSRWCVLYKNDWFSLFRHWVIAHKLHVNVMLKKKHTYIDDAQLIYCLATAQVVYLTTDTVPTSTEYWHTVTKLYVTANNKQVYVKLSIPSPIHKIWCHKIFNFLLYYENSTSENERGILVMRCKAFYNIWLQWHIGNQKPSLFYIIGWSVNKNRVLFVGFN